MISKNQIWKIYGTSYKDMTKKLLEETGLEKLIGDRKTRIGIKPNLVVPSPAEFGATTHPEVVAGIVEYLQEKQFGKITIVEGSWVGDRTSEAYEYCGYRALCEKYDVPFIDGQKEKWHSVDCAGMKLNVINAVDRIDFLINVPVIKGHCQTRMTCALKNLKGLLPNSEKSRFHRMGLHKPIAHLQKGIRQDFIVIDHICGDLDFEEGGNPVVRNCVMAALDPVLVDSYACYLMHYTPDEGSSQGEEASGSRLCRYRSGFLQRLLCRSCGSSLQAPRRGAFGKAHGTDRHRPGYAGQKGTSGRRKMYERFRCMHHGMSAR